MPAWVFDRGEVTFEVTPLGHTDVLPCEVKATTKAALTSGGKIGVIV